MAYKIKQKRKVMTHESSYVFMDDSSAKSGTYRYIQLFDMKVCHCDIPSLFEYAQNILPITQNRIRNGLMLILESVVSTNRNSIILFQSSNHGHKF